MGKSLGIEVSKYCLYIFQKFQIITIYIKLKEFESLTDLKPLYIS